MINTLLSNYREKPKYLFSCGPNLNLHMTFGTFLTQLVLTIRHGSKCAGIIAAKGNNGFCGVGLAYNARIGGKT